MTRQEAIDNLKRLCSPEQMTALRVLVPELKESEDERIINQIISLIKEVQEDEDWHVGKWSDDAIDWLEKQKEQKPALRLVGDGLISDPNSHFELVGEQKPAEWSKEDDTKFYKLVAHLDWNGNVRLAKEDCDELRNWLYDRRLKSFRPQSKQEWSEEDEKNIEKLDGFLSEVFCYGHVYVSQKEKEELQNWLKSLRPSWKPSEEQMKALLSKLPVVKGSGDKVQDILESLYNDLKKLM